MHHCKLIRRLIVSTILYCAMGSSIAATTVSGYFNDATNAALISSNGYDDLGPAQFGADANVARNVAIYQLVLAAGGSAIEFASSGYVDGGAQPYFSIFSGSGVTATFLDSSYFDPNIDFQVSETLAAGTYLFTIGVYENLSFAENDGPPDDTLAAGFTALGDPTLLGNAFYQVLVTSDGADFTVGAATLPGLTDPTAPPDPTGPTMPNNVPEPGVPALLGIGVAMLGLRGRSRFIGPAAGASRGVASSPR